MKELFIFFLIMLTSNSVFSQNGWIQQQSGTNEHLTSTYFVNNNTGWAVSGVILKTTNGGTNWIIQYDDTTNFRFYGVYFLNVNTGYAAGGLGPGKIVKTTNSGVNWFICIVDSTRTFNSIHFFDEQTGIASMTQGRICRTTNGGLNWQYIMATTAQSIVSLYFVDLNTGYACSDIGNILKTVNGGLNWVNLNSSVNYFLSDIFFNDINIGYVTGISGTILKTLNGGNNWVPLLSGTINDLHDVYFPDNITGYVAGDNGTILKTTNAGVNWNTQFTGIGSNWLLGLFFLNNNTGYATGANGTILKTTTGGEEPSFTISGNIKYADNNQPVTSGYVKALKLNMSTLEFETVDSTIILANGDYTLPNVRIDSVYIRPYPNSTPIVDFIPTFYPSSIRWETATKLYVNSNLTNINVGVIRINVSQSPGIISGTVFKPQSVGLNEALVYAKLNNVIKGFAISDNNGSYVINNIAAGTYNIIVNRPGYYSDSTLVAATGGTMSNINFSLLPYYTSVKNISTEIPKKYQLYQNFPNPFNPVTKIKFDVISGFLPMTRDENDKVVLKVFDLLGREVATLINEKLQPGTYEVSFDGSGLASGMYFCRMTKDNFSQTINIVLLK